MVSEYSALEMEEREPLQLQKWELIEPDRSTEESIHAMTIESSTSYEWLPQRLRDLRDHTCPSLCGIRLGVPQQVIDRISGQKDQGPFFKLKEKRKNYDEQVGICADLARTIAEKEAEQHDLMMRNIQTNSHRHSAYRQTWLDLTERKAELKDADSKLYTLRHEIQMWNESLKMSKNLDETYIGQYLLTLFDVAGPPVLLLMGASLLHVVALSLPWIAYQFTFCTDHSADMEYNYFLWVPFLVWTTLTTFIEWRCFSYIVVPMLAWTKTYYVVSWPLSFRLWLPCMLLAGFIYRMDVWAQGLALAKAWRSHDYLGHEELEDAWAKAWNASVFSWFQPGAQLRLTAGLAWACLALQWFIYFLRVIPFSPTPINVSYACGAERKGYVVPFCCAHIWHADALKTLASLTLMPMVLANQRRYSVQRAQWKLVAGEGLNRDFFHILKMDVRIMTWDILFRNLLITCAKLQVQTSLLALQFHMQQKHAESTGEVSQMSLFSEHWNACISIAIAHMSSAMAFISAINDFVDLRRVRSKERKDRGKKMDADAWNEYKKLACWERLGWSVLALQFILQSLALAKLWMAFHCKHALWNFSAAMQSWNMVDGCVPF